MAIWFSGFGNVLDAVFSLSPSHFLVLPSPVVNLSIKKTGPGLLKAPGRLTLATTYSRVPYRRTTIGDVAFHFRVRDGTGWDHDSKATRPLSRLEIISPSGKVRLPTNRVYFKESQKDSLATAQYEI